MSLVSSLLHHATGLPEINLLSNPTIGPVIAPLVAELEAEIVSHKLPAVLDMLSLTELEEGEAAFVAAIARRKAATPTG